MMNIKLSGFAKLLISSAVISLLIFALAFLLSLIRLGDDVVEAKVSTSGINFTLQEHWNPENIGVGAVGFVGGYDSEGKYVDESYFDNSVIEAISFRNPLPPKTDLRFNWKDNRLIISIGLGEVDKAEVDGLSVLPNSDFDILITTGAVDGKGLLPKKHLTFGRNMEIIFNPNIVQDKDIRFNFPPAVISGIDFHYDKEKNSGQYPLIKNIIEEHTMITSGEFFFSEFQNQRYTLRKSEPIRFDVNVGVIESVDITPDMMDIYFIANTRSVERTEYKFSDEVEEFSSSNFSPTALELAMKNRVFQLLIPIISFVIAIVGLFELFEVRDVFRRTFGIADTKPVHGTKVKTKTKVNKTVKTTPKTTESQKAIAQSIGDDGPKNNKKTSVDNES